MSFWSSCRLLRGGLQVRLISLINVILVEKSELLYQNFKIIDNTYLRIIFSPFFRFLWIQMNCRKSYIICFLNYRAKWDKKTCSENQIWNKPPLSLADKYRTLLFRVCWIKANQILKYDMIWNKFGRYHIAWVHITRYRPIMKSIICIISYNTKESQIRWYKITSYRIVRYCTILYNILIHQSIQHCINMLYTCYCIMPCDLLSSDSLSEILPRGLTRFSTILHH